MTKDRILKFLNEKSSASIAQISRALNLTQADIRYHVSDLVRKGQAAYSPIQHHEKPGRPSRYVLLVRKPSYELLQMLAQSLFDEKFVRSLSEVQTISLIHRLVAIFLKKKTPNNSPSLTLNENVSRLNSLGFMLHWEAGKMGPEIRILYNPLIEICNDPFFIDKFEKHLITELKKGSLFKKAIHDNRNQ